METDTHVQMHTYADRGLHTHAHVLFFQQPYTLRTHTLSKNIEEHMHVQTHKQTHI